MKQIITIFAVLSLVACSQKKEEANEPSESMEGSAWSTGCVDTGQSVYDKRTANFTGGSFTIVSTMYADSACSTGYIKMEMAGSYVISGVVSETTNYVGLDETISSINLTLLDATLVSYYNANSYCGFTNWAINVAKNIAGLTCDGSTISAAGTTGYDIYYASNGILNFGLYDASHDGMSTATRPVAIDPVYSFTK